MTAVQTQCDSRTDVGKQGENHNKRFGPGRLVVRSSEEEIFFRVCYRTCEEWQDRCICDVEAEEECESVGRIFLYACHCWRLVSDK